MDTNTRSPARYSLRFNIATSIFLSALRVASYATLLALFLTQGVHTRSLTHVHGGIIPRTAVVSLLGIILIGSTSALVTRSVEHGVWAKILHGNLELDGRTACTRQELHRRAQWSISHLERLTYTIRGQSWSMRISGILLLSAVALNPVLLYGISQKDASSLTTIGTDAGQDKFSGFVPTTGAIYAADDPVTLGSLLYLKNVSVPPSSLCSGPSCMIKARATALQAKCIAETTTWEQPSFSYDDQPLGGPFTQPIHCSTFGKDTCILMRKDTVSTHINFTSGPSNICGTRIDEVMNGDLEIEEMTCPAGDFAILFGVWYGKSIHDSADSAVSTSWHTVDCQVQYGSVSIQQNGSSAPKLDRLSFFKATQALGIVGDPFAKSGFVKDSPDYNISAASLWQATYIMRGASGITGTGPPFTFAVGKDRIAGSLIRRRQRGLQGP